MDTLFDNPKPTAVTVQEGDQPKVIVRKGDFVKITRVPGSVYNYYVNYIAEVKDFRVNQRCALLFLEATPEPRFLFLPTCHFEKIDRGPV